MTGMRSLEGWVLVAFADVAEVEGNDEMAERCLRGSLGIFRAIPLPAQVCSALVSLGGFLAARGRNADARACLHEGAAMAAEHGSVVDFLIEAGAEEGPGLQPG